jgi:hypothetical protein
VVKFGDKHKNKHVGDHSYACTVEESGALHNKNNEGFLVTDVFFLHMNDHEYSFPQHFEYL